MHTPLTIAFFLNPAAGSAAPELTDAELERQCVAVGAVALIRRIDDGTSISEAVDAAIDAGASVLVAGGGDGTVNATVNALGDRPLTLGVLPLGTLNHFARDLGIPTDLGEALQVILAGYSVRVDVGDVNGTRFVNNSSVGLYARIVQLRSRYPARGMAKWLVATWATVRIIRSVRAQRVELTVDGERLVHRAPLVFVGNNPYRMSGLDAGSRDSVQGGVLGVYVVEAEGAWRLARLVWRIIAGTAARSGELVERVATAAVVDWRSGASRGGVPVAVDGEVEALPLPLRYTVRAGCLRVLVPAPT
jgi:diacylglycerol kinase family enzyme